MKLNRSQLALNILVFLMMLLVASCVNKETKTTPSNDAQQAPDPVIEDTKQAEPLQLPVRFQNASYFTQDEKASDVLEEDTQDYEIKVGANISSTKGPQPLWDILKRVANLKGMSVSWASDVDQNVLVDVDISAEDNYFEAIDNMLRQVDYFHEVKENSIVVKYRETKRFQISIPFMKGDYSSVVGGNFLTDREAATGTEGTVKVKSADNKFDVWENITLNLDAIMQQWRTQKTEQVEEISSEETKDEDTTTTEAKVQQATRRVTLGSSYYTVDKSIGLITVTAPRPLLEKVESYLDNLKRELYRQVVIEAKIIEVFLQDNSRIGIDWSLVLKDFDINGLVEFGTGGLAGQVWPWNPPAEKKSPPPDRFVDANYPSTYPDSFIYRVTLGAVPFKVFLNALSEQGDATVLSNPKLTVLNGQPAVLSVGKDISYIKEVTSDVNNETGTVSYSVTTDSVVEGVAFGIMASIIDDESVILHLTPITTDIVGDEVQYREFADGLQIGLPEVQIRELATMVKVKSGEMLIIGGLIDSIESKDGSFAPILGDIPFIRYLFGVEEKRMEKRELVILLTPKII